MDSIITATAHSSVMVNGLVPCVMAAAVWFLELRRRGADEARHATRRDGPSCGPLPLLRQCKQEVVGVGCVMAAAIVLLGQAWSGMTSYDESHYFEGWPVLMTADTLLGLQSLLRLPLLLSVLLRSPTPGAKGPLTGIPILLMCASTVCRVSCLATDPVFWLFGPVGGNVNLASEVAALLVLLSLSWSALSTTNVAALVWSLSLAGAVATRHEIQITENNTMNAVFILSPLIDLLAAGAHLVHTMKSDGGPRGGATSFVHFLLPLQQSLCAYFFLEGFDEIPELVLHGCPFKVLQIATSVSLGLYLMATVLHIVLCVEADNWQTSTTNVRETDTVHHIEVVQSRSPVAI